MIARLLAWLSPYLVPAIGGIISLMALGILTQTYRLHSAQTEVATVKAARVQDQLTAKAAALKAQTEYRAEEQRRAQRQKEIADESEARVAAARADADAAASAAGGLRQRIAALAARGRAATCNPSAPASGAPAEDALGVFADVLGRAEARARLLAQVADRAHEAGEICVFSYGSLMP